MANLLSSSGQYYRDKYKDKGLLGQSFRNRTEQDITRHIPRSGNHNPNSNFKDRFKYGGKRCK